MESWAKGTVTPLASAFLIEEAKKAAQQVHESLETSRQELHKLEEFVQDNGKLMKLVQKLPDEMSHNIMVPFGKAAFFPGRMIHTNEFLVLLGEGYHAECTAKQTLEVLRRRSKMLDSKIEGIKAVMEDLQAEALFFTSTAAEADAGVMEIREDYVEKPPLKEKSNLAHHSSSGETLSVGDDKITGKKVVPSKLEESTPATATDVNDDLSTEDKEFDRIMSRLSELEQAEAEENGESSDESEEASLEFGRMNDHELEDSEDDEVESQSQISLGMSMGKHVPLAGMELPMSKGSSAAPRDRATIRSPADILKFEEWKTKSANTDVDRISPKKVSFQLDPVESTSIKGLKEEKEIGKTSSFQENYEQHFPSKTQVAETRFASHTIVLRRLVRVKEALCQMVISNKWGGWKQVDTKKAKIVKDLIFSDDFWNRVEYALELTEPLMSMLRYADTDEPCLGNIYDAMDSMLERMKSVIQRREQDPDTFYSTVEKIVLHRWNKMTTPLHLLAYALSPRYYSSEILDIPGRVPPYRDPEVAAGYKRALNRLFSDPDVASNVRREFVDFVSGKFAEPDAINDQSRLDAIGWWYLHGERYMYLQPLAIKILSQASKNPKVEHEDERQTDARKAFTGLVVEHGVNEVSDDTKGLNTSQVSESKPSRPVSRFKMQKANR